MARRKTRQAGRRKRLVRAYLTLISLVALVILALPTMLVTMVCMVPTLVTFIVDLTPGRHAVRCVVGLNVAGTLPFLVRLWTGQNDFTGALRVIADPMLWLLSYGAAGLGWILFFSLPSIIIAAKMFNARRRASALHERQRRLIHEWGKEIAGEHWRGFSDDIEYFEADGAEERQAETSTAGTAQSAGPETRPAEEEPAGASGQEGAEPSGEPGQPSDKIAAPGRGRQAA